MKENDNDTIENMQNNDDKQRVRNGLLDLTASFAKQTKQQISYVGLPCTDWNYEKQLAKRCKADNLGNPTILGLENHRYPYEHPTKGGQLIFPDMKAACPKGMIAEEKDFTEYIHKAISNNWFFNVVYGDFMCHAAQEVGVTTLRYTYPEINAAIEYIKHFNKPFLYIMTFYCNGRINGGKNPLIKHMGGTSCHDMPTAISRKMLITMSQQGITGKAKEVFRVSYKGGSRSNMTTIAYACNFNPNFARIKENWIEETMLEKERELEEKRAMKAQKRLEREQAIYAKFDAKFDARIAKRAKKEEIETAKYWDKATRQETKEKELLTKNTIKSAIKALSDLGWTSDKIALALSIKKGNVGATLAHYHNPDSFKGKLGRKINKAA